VNRETFFAIDVASEIRSLCDAQLRGVWQLPAELVRCAVRFGARNVSVTRGTRGFSLSWKNGPIPLTTLECLVTALDDTAEPESRQQSIAELEGTGAEALLWAGGLAGSKLSIEGVTDGQRLRFERRAGRRPGLESSPGSSPSDEVVVRWGCARVDGRRAVEWLRLACRFSDVGLAVDGRPVARGFSDGVYRTRHRDPLPCTLGLTRRGEEPVLWLLRDGIVAARAVVPGYPPFEAAVELGGVVTGTASSSDLRRAVRPYVRDLCERAVDMMIEVAGRPRNAFEDDGRRLLSLLLRSAKLDIRATEIRSLPLFPTLSDQHQPLSVARLEAMALRRKGRLHAVEPGEGGDGVLADSTSTIVAASEVRHLLSEVTGIRFQTPPRHRLGVVKRSASAVRSLVSRAVERGRGFFDSRVVAARDLSPGELRLVALLRDALAPRTVEIGSGERLRRTKTGWILPRFDPSVVAAVRCVGEDPGWLYPLVLALRLDASLSGSLRDAWTASLRNRSGDR